MRRVGSEYVLRTPIGRGSTGEVWSAATVVGDRPVAIKLLTPELVRDQATVARFVQERSILTGLRSSHLVQVHDLVAERDTLAIVMDLVPGVDLRQHLHRVGAMAPGLAVELIGQVLSALAVVHRAGIVHRDVKPENILLDLREAGRPRALLSDFGIARIVNDPNEKRPGGPAGTLRYMAPEVARSGDARMASDLYATGVVLYELLAGRPPFAATDPFGLLRAHEAEEPAPIPGLPDGLRAVLARLLAKAPAGRPASATLARQELAVAAVEVRSWTALPSLGDTDRYDGPTIPPAGTTTGDPVTTPAGGPGTAPLLIPPPIARPTPQPAVQPTVEPTVQPTMQPTVEPTVQPTVEPTVPPAEAPAPVRARAAAAPVDAWWVDSARGPGYRAAPGQAWDSPEAGPAGEPVADGTLLLGAGAGPGVPDQRPAPHPDYPDAFPGAFPGGFDGGRGEPGPPPADGRRRRLVPVALLAALALIGGIAVAALWPRGDDPAPEARGGLPAAIAPTTPEATAPAIDPATTPANTPTQQATPTDSPTPTPTPSAKPKPARVPNVVGLTRARAVTRLRGAGLGAPTVSYTCRAGGRPDRVLTQKPTAGAKVADQKASLTVQDANCRTVPNVVGKTAAAAAAKLRATGFTNILRVGGGRNPADATVIGQSLAAGSSVLRTTSIVLVLTAGGGGGGGGGQG